MSGSVSVYIDNSVYAYIAVYATVGGLRGEAGVVCCGGRKNEMEECDVFKGRGLKSWRF